MTILGNLLHFGQLYKLLQLYNYLAQNAHILRQFIFLVNSFLAFFIDIWRLFTDHTDCSFETLICHSQELLLTHFSQILDEVLAGFHPHVWA